MTAEFLAPVQAVALPPTPPLAPPAPLAPYDGPETSGPLAATRGASAAPSFGALVADGMRQVDAQLQASQVDLQRLAAGDAQNLHHVMVRLEEARIGFQLLLQVRNRLLESYQDVMRMQV